MLWSIDTCQNKVSAYQYHMTISQAQIESSCLEVTCFLKLTTNQVLVFDWIAGSCHVYFVVKGQVFRKPIMAKQKKAKQKAKQYTENLTTKLQNLHQNSRLSWVSLIGL